MEDEYELVEREEEINAARGSSVSDGLVKSTSRLPARSLPSRRRLWPFAVVGVAAIILLIVLVLLLHFLSYFNDVQTYLGPAAPSEHLSCDLALRQGSSMQNAFMINLRSARMLSFGQAKLIDVISDLFIGQGGRLLMAWAAYRVFMDELVCLMENTPISYELYVSLVFDTTSLLTAWKSMKALSKSNTWRSRTFLVWFGLSTLYVLAFPTLMGAATGYVTPSTPGYKMSDGSFLTAESDQLVNCMPVLAGSLIGLSNDTVVQGPQALTITDPQNRSERWNETYPLYYTLLTYDPLPVYHLPNGTNTTDVSAYYESYFNRSTDTYTYGTNMPSTCFSSYSNNCDYTTSITVNGHTYFFHNYTFSQAYGAYETNRYCYNNDTLPGDLGSIAQCMPETYFVWGFSSLLLYIIFSIQLVWTFIMLLVWLHANMTSNLLFKSRKVRGNYRAVTDLAEAMKDVLGDEYCTYSDEDLSRELAQQGPALRYCTTDLGDSGLSHIGLGKHGRLTLDNTRLYGARRRRKDEV